VEQELMSTVRGRFGENIFKCRPILCLSLFFVLSVFHIFFSYCIYIFPSTTFIQQLHFTITPCYMSWWFAIADRHSPRRDRIPFTVLHSTTVDNISNCSLFSVVFRKAVVTTTIRLRYDHSTTYVTTCCCAAA